MDVVEQSILNEQIGVLEQICGLASGEMIQKILDKDLFRGLRWEFIGRVLKQILRSCDRLELEEQKKIFEFVIKDDFFVYFLLENEEIFG